MTRAMGREWQGGTVTKRISAPRPSRLRQKKLQQVRKSLSFQCVTDAVKNDNHTWRKKVYINLKMIITPGGKKSTLTFPEGNGQQRDEKKLTSDGGLPQPVGG